MSSQDQTQRDEGTGPVVARLQTATIFETAERTPEIRRFVAAIRAAGLDRDLMTADFKTLFAPDNNAAAEISVEKEREQLRGILARYIVLGKQTVADLRTTSSVKTLEGDSVDVGYENGTGVFSQARIVRSDIACTNGQIHIIDKLI